MGLRRKSREYAIQALYLSEISKMSAEKALRSINYAKDIERVIMDFSSKLTEGTVLNLSQIDQMIKKYAENWELKRMAALDLTILRLGTYEIMHELETPVSVIIDEAVEMAKSFSTNESGKFVNGILDKIKNERPGGADIKNGKVQK